MVCVRLFFSGLYWIGEAFLVEAEIFAWMLPFAVTLLPAGMALYWALAASITRWVWTVLRLEAEPGPTGAVRRILILAVIFSLVEWVRGHAFTGFPWHNPGLVLTAPIELLQSVAVVGMYGLTPIAFIVTMVPLAVLATLPATRYRAALAAIAALTIAPLACAYVYGAVRLAAPAPADVANVRLRVVQPSIPQRDKWRAEKQGEFFARHLALSRQDANGRTDDLAGITHVIWPEASMPFGPLHNQEALDAIADMLPDGTHLIAGVLRRGDERIVPAPVHNSLAAIDTTGKLVALYDKIHLVPFGEYLPFPHVLEAIGLQNLVRQRGGFVPGPLPKTAMSVPGLPPFAPVICYEAIFPSEIVGDIAPDGQRPRFIVIATNDGWFGQSIGPEQHFHQARVRAVELGLPVVRSANNGISALIGPDGRVRHKLELDVVGTFDTQLPSAYDGTIATALGEHGLILVNVLILLLFSTIGIPVYVATHRLKP
ncbi:MAG: apolipoprotein N-acyltransferase [Verrucomicrobiae bacterium]|nr:apolipoprotein N-acyltransferase [Verrucomicrobiae bacterium]